jgi:hypothetical protein
MFQRRMVGHNYHEVMETQEGDREVGMAAKTVDKVKGRNWRKTLQALRTSSFPDLKSPFANSSMIA